MYFDIARLFTATQGILTLFLGSFSLIIGDITIPALCMFAVSDFAIRLTKLRHLNVYESDKTVRNTLILKSLQNVPKSLQIIPEVPKSMHLGHIFFTVLHISTRVAKTGDVHH